MNCQKFLKNVVGLILIVTSLTACNTVQSNAPGEIRGVLILQSGQSVQEIELSLCIPSEEVGGRYDNAQIYAKPNSSGAFLFSEVPPGTYAICMNPPGFLMNGNHPLVFKLEAAQSLDLGTIIR